VLLAEVEDGDDVGVDEPCCDERFLLEALPHAGKGSRLGPQDLHRRRAFETFVEGTEHASHATFAQEAVDAVSPTDQGRRAGLHRGCVPGQPVR